MGIYCIYNTLTAKFNHYAEKENQSMENLTQINEISETRTTPVDYKAEKKFVSRIGLGLFIYSIVFMIVQIICLTILSLCGENVQNNFGMIISMIPGYIIAVPLAALILRKSEITPQPNREKFSFGKMAASFFVAFAFMYVGNIVGNILNSVISLIPGFVQNNQLLSVLEGSTLPQTIIVVVIAAPIAEELIFRKLLIDRLGRYGDKTAIIVSAAAFGLFHGNITQLTYAFLIGLVFGYVYRKTGNILHTIVMHILLNLNGSVISLIVLEKSGFMDFASLIENGEQLSQEIITQYAGGLGLYLIYAMLIMAMVIAGVVIFLINKKKLAFSDGRIKLEKGRRFSTIVLNAGAILFTVTWVIMLIIAFL